LKVGIISREGGYRWSSITVPTCAAIILNRKELVVKAPQPVAHNFPQVSIALKVVSTVD
jgi:hypothetical protein